MKSSFLQTTACLACCIALLSATAVAQKSETDTQEQDWRKVSSEISSASIFSADVETESVTALPSAWWGGPKGSFWASGQNGEAFYLFDEGGVALKEHYKLKFSGIKTVQGIRYATYYETSLDGSTDWNKAYKWAFPYFPYPSNIGLPAKHERPGHPEHRHSFVNFYPLPTVFYTTGASR